MITEISSDGHHLVRGSSGSKSFTTAIRPKLTKSSLVDAQKSTFNSNSNIHNINNNTAQTPSKSRKKNKFKVRKFFFV